MNKHYETLTNTSGDILAGHRVQVIDGAGSIVTIYADAGQTRFKDASDSNVNYATSNASNGLVEFYWVASSGQTLQILDESGELVLAIADFANNYSSPDVITDIDAVLGVPASDQNLGVFTGSVIPDDQTVKAALQAIETALEVVQDYQVETAAELQALPASVGDVTLLKIIRKEGDFRLVAGTKPANDTLNGISYPSDVVGHYWDRIIEGDINPEWFGGEINNAAVDSGAAMQACLDVTKKLHFDTGVYYSTTGLVDTVGAAITGVGALLCGFHCSSPTAHLLRNAGTSAFVTGGDYSNFGMKRTVTPTTPATVAEDKTQGHGLSFYLSSNPRVESVYTYNNLVELYVEKTLSPEIEDPRGIRETGAATDRWYGLYNEGDPTGMPDGWDAGPSGNPSSTISHAKMFAYADVGNGTTTFSQNFYVVNNSQDLWIISPEAGGGHDQYFLDSNGEESGDCHIENPISDAYKRHAFYFKDIPLGSSVRVTGAWVAPTASATSSGVRIESCHGIEFQGRGDFILNSGLRGIDVTNSSGLNIDAMIKNCQDCIYGVQMSFSFARIQAYKSFAGGGGAAGAVATMIGGSRNKIELAGRASAALSPQAWNQGFNLDSSASGYTLDVSGLDPSACTNLIARNASAVTTQGQVGTHVIINPGAGPML